MGNASNKDQRSTSGALHSGCEFQDLLGRLESGSEVVVVTMMGSLCPITLSHVQAFNEARSIFLSDTHDSRPGHMKPFAEMLGFLSLNADGHVRGKMSQKEQMFFDMESRRNLVRLATEAMDWLDVEDYQGCTLQRLRKSWPHLMFTHIDMNGALMVT